MPDFFAELESAEPLASSHAQALSDLKNCQSTQALADAHALGANQLLQAALSANRQTLDTEANRVLETVLEYAMWANSMDNAFFDAQEALDIAQQEYAAMLAVADKNCPLAAHALLRADAARLEATQRLADCAREREQANTEVEDATAYFNRINAHGHDALEECITGLRADAQQAAEAAQAALLETQAASARLQRLQGAAASEHAAVSADGAAGCESGADGVQALPDSLCMLDADDGLPATQCVAVLIAGAADAGTAGCDLQHCL